MRWNRSVRAHNDWNENYLENSIFLLESIKRLRERETERPSGGTVSAKVGSRFLKTSTSHISDHKSYSRKSIAMVCYAFRITKDSRRTEKAKIKIFKKFSSASFHFLLASLRSGSEHKVPCSDNQFNSLKNLFRKFLCVCGFGFFEKQQAPWGVV